MKKGLTNERSILKLILIVLPLIILADLIAFYSIAVLNTLLLLLTVSAGLTIAMFYTVYALKVVWDELMYQESYLTANLIKGEYEKMEIPQNVR